MKDRETQERSILNSIKFARSPLWPFQMWFLSRSSGLGSHLPTGNYVELVFFTSGTWVCNEAQFKYLCLLRSSRNMGRFLKHRFSAPPRSASSDGAVRVRTWRLGVGWGWRPLLCAWPLGGKVLGLGLFLPASTLGSLFWNFIFLFF